MDTRLRAYLDKPPPRPPLEHGRYHDGRLIWLFPLGAAITGAFVASSLIGDVSLVWLGSAWLVFVLGAFWIGRFSARHTQALYRRGHLRGVSIVERTLKTHQEDRSLVVILELMEDRTDYRGHPGARAPCRYRITLGDRWLRGSDDAGLSAGDTLPILIGDGEHALVFLEDEAISAVAVPREPE